MATTVGAGDQASPWQAAPASRQRSPSSRLTLGWVQPMGLLALSAVNYVLRILTLGIYHFWGKTEVRKRIWSAVRVAGEPLEYTGTGRELFTGFLVVFGLLLLPVLLLSFGIVLAFGPQSPVVFVFQAVLYAVFFFLIGVATHRAQRYRLTRTRWRGIRGGMEGSAWSYGAMHFWTGLLIPLTLGWIIPWRSTRLQRALVSDMRFGNRAFRFDAGPGPLYLRYALLWVGTIAILILTTSVLSGIVLGDLTKPADGPRLGMPHGSLSTAAIVMMAVVLAVAYLAYAIVSAWYRASQINHFAAHTHYEGATFRADVSAGGLIWLAVTNVLLVILSLGLLAPVAQARAARYYVEHLAIDGEVPTAEIAQGADAGLTKGEGLAQVFDVDAF